MCHDSSTLELELDTTTTECAVSTPCNSKIVILDHVFVYCN
jgi:hypothetical protein